MKAKIAWIVFLLMAAGLGGASRNCCGKQQPSCFSGSGQDAVLSTAATEEDMLVSGLSPVSLFIFQLK